MGNAELWWKLFQEYASEARHHEQQQSTVTGFFTAPAAGVLTLVGMERVRQWACTAKRNSWK